MIAYVVIAPLFGAVAQKLPRRSLLDILRACVVAALITIMTFDVLFLMNGFAFVLSAAFVLSVTLPARTDGSLGEPFWTRVTKGARIYLKTPRLRGLLALSMAVSSAGAMQIVNTSVKDGRAQNSTTTPTDIHTKSMNTTS